MSSQPGEVTKKTTKECSKINLWYGRKTLLVSKSPFACKNVATKCLLANNARNSCGDRKGLRVLNYFPPQTFDFSLKRPVRSSENFLQFKETCVAFFVYSLKIMVNCWQNVLLAGSEEPGIFGKKMFCAEKLLGHFKQSRILWQLSTTLVPLEQNMVTTKFCI